jgi:hypothetical protein
MCGNQFRTGGIGKECARFKLHRVFSRLGRKLQLSWRDRRRWSRICPRMTLGYCIIGALL